MLSCRLLAGEVLREMEAHESRRYWVFLGKPERYDLETELVAGASEQWPLNRFRDQVGPGDIVYFWRAGRQSGLVGWGEVSGAPKSSSAKEKNKEGTESWVPVTYRVRFAERITRKDIAESPVGSGLAGLAVLRTRGGTNFKVTSFEVAALNSLIARRSEEAPPDPAGMDAGLHLAEELEPLNFGRTVTALVEGSFKIADGQPLESDHLLDSLLQFMGQREQQGTVDFLRDFFRPILSELSIDPELFMKSATPVERRGLAVRRDALAVLESARLLAISSASKEEIGVRHFFAGLLQAGDSSTLAHLAELCEKLDVTLGALVTGFVETTATRFKQDHTATWIRSFRAVMEERLDRGLNFRPGTFAPPSGGTADGTPASEAASEAEEGELGYAALAETLSGRLLSDWPSGGDHLRIRAEVAALAHAFALCGSEEGQGEAVQRPTIALGLFGRWGSGKSFFMAKLREEIDRLSKLETPPDGDWRYCKRIEQIEFNAWHYKEADLWASLVHHIFDTLQRRFSRENKEKEFKELIKRLDISRERRAEIMADLDQKQGELKKLSKAIDEKEEQIEGQVKKQLSNIAALPERLLQNETARKKLLELLPEVAEFLGLQDAGLRSKLQKGEQTAADLLTVIRESGAAATQTQTLGRMLLQSAASRPLLGFVAAALLAYFALPIWLDKATLWDDFIGGTGQLVALCSGPVGWILLRLNKANGVLNQIGAVESMLTEDLRQEQRQKDQVLATLQLEHERLTKQIIVDKERQAQIGEEIRQIEEQLNDLGSSQSLVDFINERAQSSDYRSRLGILALIRRDFETLSTIMTGQNASGRPAAKPHAALSGTDAEDEGDGPSIAPPQIDRIILYIDDLDRVSDSNQVLKVMEAVHLLLSLPLFNVVVAVDEWWAAQSVLSHYKEYFAPDSEGVSNGADRSLSAGLGQNGSGSTAAGPPDGPIDIRKATPREFLEKVFQICFWVRPLGQDLAERLIEGTVRQGNGIERSPSALSSSGRQEEGIQAGSDEGAGIAPSPETEGQKGSPDGDRVSAGVSEDPNTEPEIAGEAEEGLSEPSSSSISISDKDYAISAQELASLQGLARVVGRSPRTVKRFINTYRLLKAMLVHQLGDADAGSESGGVEAVSRQIRRDHLPIMILLAIQVGQPEVAVRLFDRIDDALADNDQQSFEDVLQRCLESSVIPDENPEKWRRAVKALLAVTDGRHGFQGPDKISSFDSWLLHAARFGFEEWEPRSERLWH